MVPFSRAAAVSVRGAALASKEDDATLNFSRNAALWIIVILLLFALFNLFQGSAMRGAHEELSYSQFVTQVESGQVREVTIQGQQITGEYDNGRSFQTTVPEQTDVASMLLGAEIEINVAPEDEVNPLLSILISWFPMLLLIGVWIFFMRQMQSGGGKAMGFGKSRARLLTEKVGRVTFDDVAGIDEAKLELEEIVEYLA